MSAGMIYQDLAAAAKFLGSGNIGWMVLMKRFAFIFMCDTYRRDRSVHLLLRRANFGLQDKTIMLP